MWHGGIGSSSIRWCWSFWNNFTGEFRRPRFSRTRCFAGFRHLRAKSRRCAAVALRNAPAGAVRGEVLSQRWESTQRIAGGRGRRALCAHRTAYPRTPILRGPPIRQPCNYRKGAGSSVDTQLLVFRCRFVVAKSACLRFRLTAKTALASLLLLSSANPLRWALRWGPSSAACITEVESLALPLIGAPLLRWGSSCATENGGRVRTPAPTVELEAVTPFRRGRTLAGPR